MTNPVYKGSGQPTPSVIDGITGWLGGFLGGATQPAYKTKPTVPPVPPQPPACPPCPIARPTQQPDEGCDLHVFDEQDDAVLPVGNGPITIVIQPRS
jgi:hypothetical protein